MWARWHRRSAIVLVVLLAAWSVTGVLFHLKPGWDRAYDMLDVARDEPIKLSDVVTLPAHTSAQKFELFATAIGPLYRVTSDGTTTLYDAKTGQQKSPLLESDAVALIVDAVSRSPFAADYGGIDVFRLDAKSASNAYLSGITVTIDRTSARMRQRGHDTDRIDWLYRVHYLQWTGNAMLDKVLSMLGLLLIWAVVIPGLVLFVRRLRS